MSPGGSTGFLVLYLPSHIILNQDICKRTNELYPNSPIYLVLRPNLFL